MLYKADKPVHHESPKLDRMYESVGSLITPMDREPAAHVSYEERLAWTDKDHLLPKYRGKMVEKLPE